MSWASAQARVRLSLDGLPILLPPCLPVTTLSLTLMSLSQTDAHPPLQQTRRRGSSKSPGSLPCPTTPASRKTQAKASSFSHKSMVIIRKSACGPACVTSAEGKTMVIAGQARPPRKPGDKRRGAGAYPSRMSSQTPAISSSAAPSASRSSLVPTGGR